MDTFAEKHNLNVMAGFTAERFAWYNTQARRDNVPNNLDQMQEVNAGQQGTDEANGETTYNTLVSFRDASCITMIIVTTFLPLFVPMALPASRKATSTPFSLLYLLPACHQRRIHAGSGNLQ